MAPNELADGRYVLDPAPLSMGGMGEIWAALDRTLDRQVVIKLIRFPHGEQDAALIRRFKREARLTARLDHPGVPAIYDIGTHDKTEPYIVMQLIHGKDLDDLNVEHEGGLPIGWVAAIGAQVSSVLIAAHHVGLVHRDLKPQNLILDRDGAVKVLDFGLAAALTGSDTSRLTITGQSLGTPAYMAPEQITAEPCSPSTDLYALGCTLYDLLTGEPPFTAPTSIQVQNKHLDEQPRRPSDLRGDIPPEIDEIILALLAKHPQDRPANAATVYNALAPFAEDLPVLLALPPAETDAVRAYTAIAGRSPSGRRTVEIAPPAGPPLSGADLQRTHDHAREMLRAAQPATAARLLSSIIDPATRAFGATDEAVLGLRVTYAAALHADGKHRAATGEHRSLAAAMARRYGADSEHVLGCLFRAAQGHALLGEAGRALSLLEKLLDYRLRINGPDHPAVHELRQEIDKLS